VHDPERRGTHDTELATGYPVLVSREMGRRSEAVTAMGACRGERHYLWWVNYLGRRVVPISIPRHPRPDPGQARNDRLDIGLPPDHFGLEPPDATVRQDDGYVGIPTSEPTPRPKNHSNVSSVIPG